MAHLKNFLIVLCAGLLFSPGAFAQENIQTGTQQGQAEPPPPGKMVYHPRPPVTEAGQPVIDDMEIFFHIRDEATALMAAQKVTLHDELVRQLNAAPERVDLKIAAAPLSATPRAGLYEACKAGVLVVAGLLHPGERQPARSANGLQGLHNLGGDIENGLRSIHAGMETVGGGVMVHPNGTRPRICSVGNSLFS